MTEHPLPSLPYAHGGPAGSGRLRVTPEDFQVFEIPVCEPDGAGEHVWLHVRKRGANTDWVARQLARHAGVPPKDVSYAGRKDRHAVTEQWFSVRVPIRTEVDWSGLGDDEFQILRAERHSRKLRRGALNGNRFVLRIRDCECDPAVLEDRLQRIAARGFPNYFGPQRFGRDGGNIAAAGRMFEGQGRRPPRNQRSLYLSAARSLLFNQVLARRVADASWDQVLPGEVLNLDGRRACFNAEPDDQTLAARCLAGEIHPTGPLWGRGRSQVRDDCANLEEAVLADDAIFREGLEKAGMEQERRALRVNGLALQWQLDGNVLQLEFQLPSGSFATSLLRECLSCEDASGAAEESE